MRSATFVLVHIRCNWTAAYTRILLPFGARKIRKGVKTYFITNIALGKNAFIHWLHQVILKSITDYFLKTSSILQIKLTKKC
jgi:hypothetical protein